MMDNRKRKRQGSGPGEDDYLRNAELDAEVGYGSIDGIVGNAPRRDMDLTDGQTYDEMRELAPETLPEEKESILEQLRAAQEGSKQVIEQAEVMLAELEQEPEL